MPRLYRSVMVIVMIVMVSMIMLMLVLICQFAIDKNIYFRTGSAAAIHPADAQSGSNVERSDSFAQQLFASSSMQQSAKQHVAGNSGKAFEVGYAHGIVFLSVIPSAARNPY